ncbi:acyl-CoA dehydrogenase family protein [Sneathiella limimaris]|uniref:acyl-CoA dehydrogenase family protein n=1 Tax=Sneathiella limimaris TaxID=1964213 RepID=UPI00146D0284|nr:acyl-CoA dehydrogenase family protein [Sneathiella limimaris]
MDTLNLDRLVDTYASRWGEGTVERDQSGSFVFENYEILKTNRVFSAQVPKVYGGSEISHSQMVSFIRRLAHYSPSTALALSMHQHLVSAAKYNDAHGKPGKKVLELVGQKEVVLVSTGAKDWLDSTGSVERVDGGYKVSAIKPFASGSPAAAAMITSAPYEHPEEGWQVLHFPVSLSAEGVNLLGDWDSHGMRETGSQTIQLRSVFVPDEAVALIRARAGYHAAFNVILVVALPLIMAAYVGVAEKAAEMAIAFAQKGDTSDLKAMQVGRLRTQLTKAQIGLESMVRLANDLEFSAELAVASNMLCHKTLVAEAVVETVEQALKITGGAGFVRKFGLEKLLRDAHAAQFHPLPEDQQYLFCGRIQLGQEPVT